MPVSEVATAAPSAVEKMADGGPAGKSAADAGEASPAALAAASTAGGGGPWARAGPPVVGSFTPSGGGRRGPPLFEGPTTRPKSAVPPSHSPTLPPPPS